MSDFKFLIDTNVVIGLEDNHQVDSNLTELVRRSSANGVRLFADEAVDDDIRRDRDRSRQEVTLSKLAKFEKLKGVKYPSDVDLTSSYGSISSDNDRSDARLLYCLELNAADFLITRDLRLHRRARRSGLAARVLSVEDAVEWLRQTFEPKTVELPFVVERSAYAVDVKNSLFDGLRADYRGFDEWFGKCAKEHRNCWIVEVGGQMAGIVVRKDEAPAEAGIVSSGTKILKLCTFVMAPEYRGDKFGEQLLKQSLWFAQANEYDVVYLTAFADKEALIALLQSYGFENTQRQENGELFFEKVLRHGSLDLEGQTSALALDRKYYPRFYAGERVKKFCVPIQGPYHEKLFPEISFRRPLPLFPQDRFGRELAATQGDIRTPGNTICKVYLCRARTQSLQPGDLLFFYLSKDARLEASQSITTVGIVESVTECGTAEELIRLTAKRSVFSAPELESLQAQSRSPIKVIDFLLAGHSIPPVHLDRLISEGVFVDGHRSRSAGSMKGGTRAYSL